MFETIFVRPKTIARHRNGPLAAERERYLRHCEKQGYARQTIQLIACELMVIIRRMRISRGKLSIDQIEAEAKKWARSQQRCKRARTLQKSIRLFRATAIGWLRFLGRLEQPQENRNPGAKLIDQFEAYMRDERGLSDSTIRRRCWHAEKLLDYLPEHSLRNLRLERVDAYLVHKGTEGWARTSLLTTADALRSFLRYAEQRRWCPPGIAEAIVIPRVYRYEGLARGIDWPAVQNLIANSRGDHARDIRDHAILLLLALYGLRSGEMRRLRLEDVDWKHDTLWVRRQKQRRAQQYPLDAMAGEAILRYLRQVRPRCKCREVFLTLSAPYRPLSPGVIYHVVRSRLDALGLPATRRGPHSLRHACANHLLACGFSLKQIGDHLGHRSADATRIYAKVDLMALRQVAEIDLRGLL
jgi:site-specific recombinase XerD